MNRHRHNCRKAAARATGLATGLVIASVALTPAGGAQASDGDAPPGRWEWPLKADPAVSSNFCEYREGHFHAGLDIRTYGKDGVPCIAAADGYVSRLRASPEGYGKTIYIHADSGETLVYAHLAEFDPVLEDALYDAQRRAGRYVVDVRFPPGRLPVRRGDVIAWSGSTGGVAPHLHFEIRDAGENPLNPFSNGFALDDELPPVFEAVQIAPLGPGGRINGHCWPVELKAEQSASGRFYLPDTLHIVGEVGLAVEVFDRLNRRSGRLAPYSVELSVDGETVGGIRLERFSFAHTGQVDFLYDISRIRREKAYFVQLFAGEGEALWDRRFRFGGALAADGEDVEGPLGGVVRATDAAGNESELVFWYYGDASQPLTRRTWEQTPLYNGTDPDGLFISGPFASVQSELGDVPRPKETPGAAAAVAFDGYRPPVVYTARDLLDGPYPVTVSPTGDGDRVFLIGVESGTPTAVEFPELKTRLVFGSKTLFDDAIVYAGRWNAAVQSPETGELIAQSRPVRIGPYSTTLRADVEIRFELARPDTAAAIYRLNERKQTWVHYESSLDGGGVSTTAKRPGVYGVFSDTRGPRILRPYARARASYATGARRPEIVVPIEDSGSGVDHRKTSIFLAGTEQIAYWDSQAKKMLVVVRDPNIMGPRAITVVAYDKIGNRSQLESSVDIPVTPQLQGND